jgi:hypothetical protein
MAKIDDLILFVQLHKPAFLLITETFLSNSIPDSLVNLDGYTFIALTAVMEELVAVHPYT